MTKSLEDALNRAAALPEKQQAALAILMNAEMDALARLGKIRINPNSALGGLLGSMRREFHAGLDEPTPPGDKPATGQ